MEVNIIGLLLDVVDTEWEYDGQKGISHKLHVYSDGTLYKIAINAEDVPFYKEQINKPVELTCSLFVKGSYNLKIK